MPKPGISPLLADAAIPFRVKRQMSLDDVEAVAKDIIPDGDPDSKEWHHSARVVLGTLIFKLNEDGRLGLKELRYYANTASYEELKSYLGRASANLISPEKASNATRAVLANCLDQYAAKTTGGLFPFVPYSPEQLQELSEQVRLNMLGRMALQREQLGLSQGELAIRAGVSRMTVQRAEVENGNVSLDSFCQLAVALGMTPTLMAPGESVQGDGDPRSAVTTVMVHRGLHHNRTQRANDSRDRNRELSLANSWEKANAEGSCFTPTLQALLPGYTQDQATAAASVMQWLGSDVGFDFLTRALGVAGYDVVLRD